MRTFSRTTLAALGIAGLFGAGSANAVLIDFTDSTQWQGANTSSTSPLTSNSSYSVVGDVTLSVVSPVGDYISFGADPNGPTPPLTMDNDGVGISSTSANPDDEITLDRNEILGVAFQNATTVTGLHFLDLFQDPFDQEEEETIQVKFLDANSGVVDTLTFDGAEPLGSGNDGYLFAVVNVSGVQSLELTMTGTGTDNIDNDAALAAVQVVPIPAAAWLFGSALAGMAGIGYRRSRKA